MDNSIISFSFDQTNNIRTIIVDGAPMFVAKDVAVALGYAEPHKAITRHCKRAKSLKDMDGTFHPVQQNQLLSELDPKTKLIPEPDIYRLIASSHLPSAEKFEAWIFEEVLPTIRKTGSYQMADMPSRTADYQAIERIVWMIAGQFNMKGMAKHAIYTGLRRQYGLKGSVKTLPTALRYDCYDLLTELNRVTARFAGMMHETEKRFFHRVLRNLIQFDPAEFETYYDAELQRIEKDSGKTSELLDYCRSRLPDVNVH